MSQELHSFADAYHVLVQFPGTCAVRRKNWRAFLVWRVGDDTIKMVWPSGAEHEWYPCPEDLVAFDYVLMVSGGKT
jgi:hypothetical protein